MLARIFAVRISKMNEVKMKRKKLLIGIIIIIAAVVACLIAVVAYSRVSYKNRWYDKTVINGVDVSGQSLDQSIKTVESKTDGYKLTVQGRKNGKLVIDGDKISYKISAKDALQKLFQEEHSHLTLPNMKHSFSADYKVTYNKQVLDQTVDASALVKGSKNYKITAPKDAYITYSTSKKQMTVAKEDLGNTIVPSELDKAIATALKQFDENINLANTKSYPNVYQKPKVTSDDKTLNSLLSDANQMAIRWASWKISDKKTEELTPSDISKWIVVKNGRVTYDEKKLEDWVEAFCLKYKTVGGTRKVKLHTGKTVKVAGGDYGWQMDYKKTLAQVQSLMTKKADTSAVNAYIKNPTSANEKALTTSYKVDWLNKGKYLNLKNKMQDYDTKNYTEVDLSAQTAYIIRNGKVKYSSVFISGLPVPGRQTTTGCFFIKEHQRHRTLVGANYRTPVEYWTRITWTGTGFHAAPWQPWGSWSPYLYRVHGSHGCLNMTNSSAAMFYKLTKYKEFVVMHY